MTGREHHLRLSAFSRYRCYIYILLYSCNDIIILCDPSWSLYSIIHPPLLDSLNFCNEGMERNVLEEDSDEDRELMDGMKLDGSFRLEGESG